MSHSTNCSYDGNLDDRGHFLNVGDVESHGCMRTRRLPAFHPHTHTHVDIPHISKHILLLRGAKRMKQEIMWVKAERDIWLTGTKRVLVLVLVLARGREESVVSICCCWRPQIQQEVLLA